MNLGRKQLHDPKSRDYAFPRMRRASRLPYRTRHLLNAPNVDQFYSSGCVGGTGNNALNTTHAVGSRVRFNQVVHQSFRRSFLPNEDFLRNYSEATKRDPWPGEYPPTDEGSSALGLMKWWKEAGIITGYKWAFTFDAFLLALESRPVLVGTEWHDDMMTTEADGVVRSMLPVGDGSGHEYLADEIIPNGVVIRRKNAPWLYGPLIGFDNSWGENPPNFGVGGRFWMHPTQAEELIIHRGGDVAVPEYL